MESLVKFTQEHLSLKNEAQLRKVLRKDFAFAKGTSIMTKEQLVAKILEFKTEKQSEIDQNSGLDQATVYKDLKGSEWKITSIEDGLVKIINGEGHATNTTIISMKQTFQQMKYCQFTTESIPPVLDAETPIEEAASKKKISEKVSTTKQLSKSDLVRQIIKKQYDENLKITSGTVMKELKQEHDLEIHRSFCSALITKFKKSLDGSE